MDFVNTIKNYNYKQKYDATAGQVVNAVGGPYYKFKQIFDKLFIESDIEGIGNITFDLEKKESLKLQSTITDYTLENQEPTQNHIVLKPIEITFTGCFSENTIKAPKKTKINQVLQSKLNPLATFTPNLTIQAQQYLNKLDTLAQKVNNIVDKIGTGIEYIYNLTKTLPTQQAKQCMNLMTLWKSRTSVVVKTKFITLENMVIQDVSIEGPEETRDKIDVVVTLKQITFTNVKTVKKTAKLRSNQTNTVDKGKTQGKVVSQAKQILTNIIKG